MKAIVALLGTGDDLAHPRRYPARRILDHHRQRQPLTLTRAQHLRPRPSIARRAQRQPEQISRVQVHPRQHRLALTEHLVERPGLHTGERALLEVAERPGDFELPGYRLHPLRGDRAGQWSIRVSGNWRIVFRFDGAEAVDVELTDYH